MHHSFGFSLKHLKHYLKHRNKCLRACVARAIAWYCIVRKFALLEVPISDPRWFFYIYPSRSTIAISVRLRVYLFFEWGYDTVTPTNHWHYCMVAKVTTDTDRWEVRNGNIYWHWGLTYLILCCAGKIFLNMGIARSVGLKMKMMKSL